MSAKTGAGRAVVLPSPSWPTLLYPQHSTLPPETRAQAWAPPTVIAVAVVIPETITGVVMHRHPVVIVVPLPSWPSLSDPQHITVPPESRPQTWPIPAATIVVPEMPETATGLELFTVVLEPFPSSP